MLEIKRNLRLLSYMLIVQCCSPEMQGQKILKTALLIQYIFLIHHFLKYWDNSRTILYSLVLCFDATYNSKAWKTLLEDSKYKLQTWVNKKELQNKF